MLEFRIVRRGSKPKSRVTDVDFRRADLVTACKLKISPF